MPPSIALSSGERSRPGIGSRSIVRRTSDSQSGRMAIANAPISPAIAIGFAVPAIHPGGDRSVRRTAALTMTSTSMSATRSDNAVART